MRTIITAGSTGTPLFTAGTAFIRHSILHSGVPICGITGPGGSVGTIRSGMILSGASAGMIRSGMIRSSTTDMVTQDFISAVRSTTHTILTGSVAEAARFMTTAITASSPPGAIPRRAAPSLAPVSAEWLGPEAHQLHPVRPAALSPRRQAA